MKFLDFSEFKHVSVPGSESARNRSVLIFLGNSLEFPNHNLDVIANEMAGIDVLRLETVSEVVEISRQDRVKVLLLMVAQGRLEDLTSRFTRYTDAAPGARIVYSYESEDSAAQVYRTEIGQVISYLPMRCRVDVWAAYLRLLCSGECVLPMALALQDASQETEHTVPNDDASSVRLTRREREVLAMVADGASNRDIAQCIGISEHTVKLHLHNVFAKLDVSNRAGAVAWFVRNVA